MKCLRSKKSKSALDITTPKGGKEHHDTTGNMIAASSHLLSFIFRRCTCPLPVVVTGLFFLFLLRKHFITEKKFKKKSGDVNDEANFSFFILLHKRANPILPSLPTPSPPRALSLWLNRVKDSTNPLLCVYPKA